MRSVLALVACNFACSFGCNGGTHQPSTPAATPTPTAVPDAAVIEAPAAQPVSAAALDAQVRTLRESLSANPEDAASWWSLSVALAQLRPLAAPCTTGATVDEILDALEQAVHLDPTRKGSVMSEPALAALGSSPRLRLLSGLDPKADLAAVFTGATWSGPPSGVLSSTGELRLLDGGAAAGSTRVLGDAGPVETTFGGTWTAVASRPGLDLVIDGVSRTLSLNSDGSLREGGVSVWLATPSECGA